MFKNQKHHQTFHVQVEDLGLPTALNTDGVASRGMENVDSTGFVNKAPHLHNFYLQQIYQIEPG